VTPANQVDAARSALYQRDLKSFAAVLEELGSDACRDLQTADGSPFICLAAGLAYADFVECLLDAGAEVETRSREGLRPLHLATKRRMHQMGDCRVMRYDGEHVPYDGDVWRDTVEVLLLHGAKTDVADGGGRTALHHAVENGAWRAAALLVAAGAATDATDQQGRSAGDTAEGRKESARFAFLVRHSEMPLHLAALAGGSGRLLARMCGTGEGLGRLTEHRHSSLHYAVYHQSQVGPVLALLEAGADPCLPDVDGDTPLHGAAECGHAAQVKCLCSCGANPRQGNNAGKTAFQVALEQLEEQHANSDDDVIDMEAESRQRVVAILEDNNTP
jgi:uncharacterized protein